MSTEDADALRAEIKATREELGETAEALAAKTDIKGRAKEAAIHAVREHPVPPAAVGLLGAAAIAIAIYASKRR